MCGSQGINNKTGDFKWLWYLNTYYGAFHIVSAILIIGFFGSDNWFFGFYFSKKPAVQPQSVDQFWSRMFGLVLFALNVSNLVRPACKGVGLITFWLSVFYFFHFAAVVGLNIYDLTNRFTIWPFWIISCAVMAILFGIALNKAGISTHPYKDWS